MIAALRSSVDRKLSFTDSEVRLLLPSILLRQGISVCCLCSSALRGSWRAANARGLCLVAIADKYRVTIEDYPAIEDYSAAGLVSCDVLLLSLQLL